MDYPLMKEKKYRGNNTQWFNFAFYEVITKTDVPNVLSLFVSVMILKYARRLKMSSCYLNM